MENCQKGWMWYTQQRSC